MIKFINFFGLIRITACLFLALSVMAGPSVQASEKIENYPIQGAPTPSITVDEYSRFLSTIRLEIPAEAGKRMRPGQAVLQCSGSGTWDVDPRKSSGNCWDEFDYTYNEVHADSLSSLLARIRESGYEPKYKQIDTRGEKAIYEVRYTVPAKKVDETQIRIEPYTKCIGGRIDSVASPSGSKVKQHCVFDNDANGIIGHTGDDMFKIKPNASAYMEYVDIGTINEIDRLKWIERSGGGTDIMMPAGPGESSATPYQDYKDFLRNKPAAVSKVEGACYAVTASLCDMPMPAKAPPAPGYCGAASGQIFASIADINAVPYGRCYVGTPTAVTETISGDKTLFQWRCQSDPVGAAPDTHCSAPKIVDGKCGPANGGSYNTADQVNKAGLCAFGSPSRIPTGPGSWSWSCSAGAGGKAEQCMASTKASADNCNAMAYEGALVLVQDLSGSYWDDLSNLRNNMSHVVNDPDFKSWKIGVTSFIDFYSGLRGTSYSDYPYKKHLDLRDVSTSAHEILAAINGFNLGYGGDYEESQYYAISRTLADFKDQTSWPLNIVLATDATSHLDVPEANLAAQLKDAGASLTVLATGSHAANFYNQFLTRYRIPGSVVSLASDSSNFRTALKAGLTNAYCSSPESIQGCGPLNGITCSSSNLGDSCRSSSVVPDKHFTYINENGVRNVYQCRNQALFFFRSD